MHPIPNAYVLYKKIKEPTNNKAKMLKPNALPPQPDENA